MSYTPYPVSLSTGQRKKLAKAIVDNAPTTIALDSKSLAGDGDIIHITETQRKKLEKAKQNSRGARLQFSQAQIRHMRKNINQLGSGIGTVLASLAPTLISAAQPLIEGIAGKLFGGQKGQALAPAGAHPRGRALGPAGVSGGGDVMDLDEFLDSIDAERVGKSGIRLKKK